jgi:hypothetical protein
MDIHHASKAICSVSFVKSQTKTYSSLAEYNASNDDMSISWEAAFEMLVGKAWNKV